MKGHRITANSTIAIQMAVLGGINARYDASLKLPRPDNLHCANPACRKEIPPGKPGRLCKACRQPKEQAPQVPEIFPVETFEEVSDLIRGPGHEKILVIDEAEELTPEARQKLHDMTDAMKPSTRTIHLLTPKNEYLE